MDWKRNKSTKGDDAEVGDATTPDDVMSVSEAVKEIGGDAPTTRTVERWARAEKIRTWSLTRGGREVTGVSVAELRAFVVPKATRADDVPTVTEAAVQGWADTREALVLAREGHVGELERLQELASQAIERETARAQAAEDRAREEIEATVERESARVAVAEAKARDAVRWGRGAAAALVLVVAGAAGLVVVERDRVNTAKLEAAAAELQAAESAVPAVERLADGLAVARERAGRAEAEAAAAERRADDLSAQAGHAGKAMGEALARALTRDSR